MKPPQDSKLSSDDLLSSAVCRYGLVRSLAHLVTGGELSMKTDDRNVRAPRVTVDLILRHLRKQHFAVLATVGAQGQSHSAGVTYGVSSAKQPVAFYVMTRRHLQKARDIAENPQVSLVIPVPRRVLWFLPLATIQVRGHAEILDWQDPEGMQVFRRFWIGRRILDAYRLSYGNGERRICFLKIVPDPVIATYLLGSTIWHLRGRMEAGAARVALS